MKKLSTVCRKKQKLYIDTYSKTEAGFWIVEGSIEVLPEVASPAEIAKAVRQALERSRQGVPTPDPTVDRTRDLVKLAGERSYSAFVNGLVSCEVATEGDEMRVYASDNKGIKGGIINREPPTMLVSPSDEELGAAIKSALDASL
jgi:hypothetical protein